MTEPAEPAEPAVERRAESALQPAAPAAATATIGDELPLSGAKRRSRAQRVRRTLTEWVVIIAAAVLFALVLRAFLVAAFYIPSESMIPTLKVKDRVLVNKLAYHFHAVHRGDIVVFTRPKNLVGQDEIKDLVKRVVGLPGETIEGRGGGIYIDGRLLAQPYLPKDVRSRTFGPQTVPPDSYFVLGDNRQYSKDSTYFGPIRRSEIVGRVFLRFLPFGRIGFIGPSYLIPVLVAAALALLASVLVAVIPRSSRRARAP